MSQKPKHDEIIRSAFENPLVSKEFFQMHLYSMNFKNWRCRSIRASVLKYYYTLRSSPYELLALFEVDLRISHFIYLSYTNLISLEPLEMKKDIFVDKILRKSTIYWIFY